MAREQRAYPGAQVTRRTHRPHRDVIAMRKRAVFRLPCERRSFFRVGQKPKFKPTIASNCAIDVLCICTTQPPEQKNEPLLLVAVK